MGERQTAARATDFVTRSVVRLLLDRSAAPIVAIVAVLTQGVAGRPAWALRVISSTAARPRAVSDRGEVRQPAPSSAGVMSVTILTASPRRCSHAGQRMHANRPGRPHAPSLRESAALNNVYGPASSGRARNVSTAVSSGLPRVSVFAVFAVCAIAACCAAAAAIEGTGAACTTRATGCT